MEQTVEPPGRHARPVHVRPEDGHVIRAEDFGHPGLEARESVGPYARVQAVGSLLMVHDSTVEAGRGIGHHPHQGMERLFYLLEGTLDHDDALNHITGHMGTGDLGILTEGRRGMIHSEWNHGAVDARAFILVYPNRPLAPSAAFDAVRDAEARRSEPAPGVRTKHVLEHGAPRVGGDVRGLADSALEAGATLPLRWDPEEAGLVFVVSGAVRVDHAAGDDASPGAPSDEPRVASTLGPLEALEAGHSLALPPRTTGWHLTATADRPTRLLHVATGAGHGVRLR